ncbi:MAG: indolepyruvate ferredoxin oxidoreductase subunit alpha, partial [archaeon]|nr:indolepyruvate ferredoxin oxidoreductase subunit alpha [archaeon]
MTTPYIAEDSPGKKGIMLGNDAIARGILEAGVVIAAGYPGTPSSEIMDALARAAPHHSNLKLEWSVNEKIAFEIAYAGSMSKARSVAVMKHIGVNVASDPFMSACYMGAKGGMVLISADDPNQFSSQNEQDNRYYGIHALIPVFEPSTPQEAKDLIKYAFEFSEKNNSIVLFRTTTRLNHGRGNISLGEIEKIERQYEFDHDRSHWVCVPSNMRPQRIQLLERLKHIKELADDFPFNNLSLSENKINGKKYGFIASGMAYAILMDVLSHYELVDQVSILKLGMVYPMPKELMKKLLNSVDELIVVEELEPIFENSFKKLAFEEGISDQINIQGKNLFPQNGEFTAELLLEKIAQLTGMEFTKVLVPDDIIQIPTRAPQLCPCCSHRHTFYALNKISKKLKKKFINC